MAKLKKSLNSSTFVQPINRRPILPKPEFWQPDPSLSTSTTISKLADFHTFKTFPFNIHVICGKGFPPAMHFNKPDPPSRSWRSGDTKMKYGSRLPCRVDAWIFGLEIIEDDKGSANGSSSSSSRISRAGSSKSELEKISELRHEWIKNSKNVLLIKLFCFYSDFDETWWSCSTHLNS